MRVFLGLLAAAAAALVAPAATAQAPSLQSGTVLEAAQRLRAGEYLWAPEVAPRGPVLMVVSLATQRAVIYRNGLPIGITTVSTGRPGYRTPTGVFTVLQKHVEHYSSLYNNAPMPFMQRLTWGGVALHGGQLPGYPASHGCIRLPQEFARLLFGVTELGMTVVVTDQPVVPRIAPAEALLGRSGGSPSAARDAVSWNPQRAPTGPVSIVISAGDRQAVVLRNGIVIGSSPVTIDGAISQPSAYVLSSIEGARRNWIRVPLPGQSPAEAEALAGRIGVPDEFRRSVESVLAVGTTVVVTADSLQPTPPHSVTVIQDESGR
jgi:hypothetical protein